MKISNLLYREDRWIKGALAKSKDGTMLQNLNIYHFDGGKEIDPSVQCVAYSLQGAIVRLYSGDSQGDMFIRLGNIVRNYFGQKVYLAQWNDDPATSFQDVKNVLKLAGL